MKQTGSVVARTLLEGGWCARLFPANSFQVARQSRYIQGYRVFYRIAGGSWLVRDVEATSDYSAVLADLQSKKEYEVKIRPYFNELQGHDSLMVLVRTPDEGMRLPTMQQITSAISRNVLEVMQKHGLVVISLPSNICPPILAQYFLLFLALSGPPQAVSVVQLTNSSSISVSWEPPPHNVQTGIILEYKVGALKTFMLLSCHI